MKNSTIVFNYKLSNYLLKHGFEIESIKEHKQSKGILIFHFKTGKGIQTAIEEYKRLYSENKSKSISKEEKLSE